MITVYLKKQTNKFCFLPSIQHCFPTLLLYYCTLYFVFIITEALSCVCNNCNKTQLLRVIHWKYSIGQNQKRINRNVMTGPRSTSIGRPPYIPAPRLFTHFTTKYPSVRLQMYRSYRDNSLWEVNMYVRLTAMQGMVGGKRSRENPRHRWHNDITDSEIRLNSFHFIFSRKISKRQH